MSDLFLVLSEEAICRRLGGGHPVEDGLGVSPGDAGLARRSMREGPGLRPSPRCPSLCTKVFIDLGYLALVGDYRQPSKSNGIIINRDGTTLSD